MHASDKENRDLYNCLVNKGISEQEIQKVHKILREKGYGEEEARRRSGAIVHRLKAERDLAERRRASRSVSRSAAGVKEKTSSENGRAARTSVGEGPADGRKRRAMDWLPPLSPHLRRKIDFWAFRRGYLITRFSELFNSFMSIFDHNRKDYVSRKFLELLGERKGYLVANPFEYSLLDTMEALRFSSRRLLGEERPARHIAEKEKARNLADAVKRSLRVREPFALEFFGLFADRHEMLMKSLQYIGTSLKSNVRVEVSALARLVHEVFRLILMTEGIETERLDVLFDVLKEVNLVHDRSSRVLAELSEAQMLFLSAFQSLPVFKRELFPALLKMIASFYEDFDHGPREKARIYAFLQLTDDLILTYTGFQKRVAEMREKALKEQKEMELERLEQEKREKFSYTFEGTLTTLSSLFPESGVERVEQGEFVLPYFATRVFPGHPLMQRRLVDMERLAVIDVMGLVIVIHMILEDLLDSTDGYALEKLLSRQGMGEEIAALREDWKSVYDALFEPYLDEIRELAQETEGDPRYAKIFRESLRARSIEERANQLRNHTIKNYGHLLSLRDDADVPKLYELAETLNGLLMEIGESVNPDLLDAEDAVRKKLFEDLAAAPAVDFSTHTRAGSPGYKPVARQVGRSIEARFRQNVTRVPQLAHVVFFDVFRGIADLYCYLLNDRKSFAAETSHVVTTAGETERNAWKKESDDRGRDSLLLLRNRLSEDYPGRFEDGLTGLKNKEYFLGEFPPWAEKQRAAGKPLTFLMIDIDHFKWVNDELGHQAGDEVLKETAGMILDNIREGDVAIRYGGEEILVAVCSDLHTGIILAERLRFLQEQNVRVKASFIGVKLIAEQRKEPCGTLSVGAADAGAAPDLGEGVRRADKALYAAKRSRNRLVFMDPEKKGGDPFTTYADYRGASESPR